MRNYTGLLITTAIAISCASAARAYTVTFDEVPAGTNPTYYLAAANVLFPSSPLSAIEDHSAASWGPPHSGSNVLAYYSVVEGTTLEAPPLDTLGRGTPAPASYFGAYFSTPSRNEFTMTLYRLGDSGLSPITSLTVGSRTEIWNNRYVGFGSPAGDICRIGFQPVWLDPPSDPHVSALFCVDDMTITPVPEPSSLAALICGLAGMGGVVVRRRR